MTEDADFERAIEHVTKATKAVSEWEKAHGEVLNQQRFISCPCCGVEDALRFLRTLSHLYVECATPDCVPQIRGSTRGRRR